MSLLSAVEIANRHGDPCRGGRGRRLLVPDGSENLGGLDRRRCEARLSLRPNVDVGPGARTRPTREERDDSPRHDGREEPDGPRVPPDTTGRRARLNDGHIADHCRLDDGEVLGVPEQPGDDGDDADNEPAPLGEPTDHGVLEVAHPAGERGDVPPLGSEHTLVDVDTTGERGDVSAEGPHRLEHLREELLVREVDFVAVVHQDDHLADLLVGHLRRTKCGDERLASTDGTGLQRDAEGVELELVALHVRSQSGGDVLGSGDGGVRRLLGDAEADVVVDGLGRQPGHEVLGVQHSFEPRLAELLLREADGLEGRRGDEMALEQLPETLDLLGRERRGLVRSARVGVDGHGNPPV